MEYKYETHLHTSISSRCGKSKGSEYIPLLKKLGYTGAFVTDHFIHSRSNYLDLSRPWPEVVECHCKGYHEAKEAADRENFQLFFAWESTFDNGEDFLIYGLDEDWLLKNPDIANWDQKQQYEHVHGDGGFVVQAHPFRERYYQPDVKLHPYHCDAWKIANGHNLPYQDRLARDWAEKFDLPVTAGTDIHIVDTEEELAAGRWNHFGVITEKPITCPGDYKNLILSRTGCRLVVPEDRYDLERMNPFFPVWLYDKNHERTQMDPVFYEGAPTAKDPHIQ